LKYRRTKVDEQGAESKKESGGALNLGGDGSK